MPKGRINPKLRVAIIVDITLIMLFGIFYMRFSTSVRFAPSISTPTKLSTATNTFIPFTPAYAPSGWVPTATNTLVPFTPDATQTQTPTALTTKVPTATNTLIPFTPNATQTLQAAFGEIDRQFRNTIQSNIAFNKPKQMKRSETTLVEICLNPSISAEAIATELVRHGNLVTSTAEPEQLIAIGGVSVSIETATINISPRMKAVLQAQDAEAFTITPLHDNPEQVIVPTENTCWRWSVTAKKEGVQVLELTLYQLLEYNGEEFWHEVETFHANIIVEVTVADRIKAWDWKWLAGYILTFIGTLLATVTWIKNNNKKNKSASRQRSKVKKANKR